MTTMRTALGRIRDVLQGDPYTFTGADKLKAIELIMGNREVNERINGAFVPPHPNMFSGPATRNILGDVPPARVVKLVRDIRWIASRFDRETMNSMESMDKINAKLSQFMREASSSPFQGGPAGFTGVTRDCCPTFEGTDHCRVNCASFRIVEDMFPHPEQTKKDLDEFDAMSDRLTAVQVAIDLLVSSGDGRIDTAQVAAYLRFIETGEKPS